MSIPLSTADEDPPVPDHWPGGLAALRNEIDGIDDAIHDLLMRRAAVIGQVAATKADTRVAALRPGREAAILRRLLSRHTGTLPRQAIVRIWRELLAATTAMQGAFVIAVAEPEAGAGLVQAAREQFGALTAQRVHGSAAQAIADLSNGRASVAVLPLPSESEAPGRAWWTALMQKDEPRIHIVGRLPFWARRSDEAPSAQAMVAASFAADPSGVDRSLLGLELNRDVSRARLMAALSAAGLSPGNIIIRRDAGSPVAQALVEVEGYVTDDDARLTMSGSGFHKPVVLGAYAIPLGESA